MDAISDLFIIRRTKTHQFSGDTRFAVRLFCMRGKAIQSHSIARRSGDRRTSHRSHEHWGMPNQEGPPYEMKVGMQEEVVAEKRKINEFSQAPVVPRVPSIDSTISCSGRNMKAPDKSSGFRYIL